MTGWCVHETAEYVDPTMSHNAMLSSATDRWIGKGEKDTHTHTHTHIWTHPGTCCKTIIYGVAVLQLGQQFLCQISKTRYFWDQGQFCRQEITAICDMHLAFFKEKLSGVSGFTVSAVRLRVASL